MDDPKFRVVDGVIWALIALSIGLVVLELTATDLPAWLGWLDQVLLVAFMAEYALRVGSWHPPTLDFYTLDQGERLRAHIEGRIRFALRPLMLVDLLTLLALVPALRGLRALRLLRIMRTSKVFRYSSPVMGVGRALQDNALLYAFAFSFLAGVTVLGGISMFLVEGPRQLETPTVVSLSDGVWWSIVTLTTVGYGDISPSTALGRVIAGCLMVLGMVTLALFAGIVGQTLLSAVLTIRQEQFRMSSELNHVVVFGYDAGARMLLDVLDHELDSSTTGVLILAPGERPVDLPPAYRWIQGDPTKESELDKARVAFARAVIVVGLRQDTPQRADAITLLSLFTLRSYLRKQAVTKQRQHGIYVVAEILDSENVDHAYSSGADEVIESTRLGFSVIVHAVTNPGTAHVLGQVASHEAQSLFVGGVPGNEPVTFEVLSARLKAELNALPIAIRRPDGREILNPPSGTLLGPEDAVIYLAESAVLPLTE